MNQRVAHNRIIPEHKKNPRRRTAGKISSLCLGSLTVVPNVRTLDQIGFFTDLDSLVFMMDTCFAGFGFLKRYGSMDLDFNCFDSTKMIALGRK